MSHSFIDNRSWPPTSPTLWMQKVGAVFGTAEMDSKCAVVGEHGGLHTRPTKSGSGWSGESDYK